MPPPPQTIHAHSYETPTVDLLEIEKNIEKHNENKDNTPIIVSPELAKAFTDAANVQAAMRKLSEAESKLATNDLEKIKTPTLILWGEKDEVAPLRTGYILNKFRYYDVTLHTF